MRCGVLTCTAVLALSGVACQPDRMPEDAVAHDRLDYRIDQQIGQDLNDENASFGRITGLARSHTGRLFVADYQAARVAVFDGDGTFLHSVGRQGAGPGELQNPCCLVVDDQDRLWVRDGLNRRYSVYALKDKQVRHADSHGSQRCQSICAHHLRTKRRGH